MKYFRDSVLENSKKTRREMEGINMRFIAGEYDVIVIGAGHTCNTV